MGRGGRGERGSLINRHERQSAIISVAFTGSGASESAWKKPRYRSQIDAAFELFDAKKNCLNPGKIS